MQPAAPRGRLHPLIWLALIAAAFAAGAVTRGLF
jgi:hypothetical protein